MDPDGVGNLLVAIRDAVSATRQRDDDIALPLFDPEKNDCGAASWCHSIEILSKELNWSSIKTAAKAGKALKGSALLWFESWDPPEGRTWEQFSVDIVSAYPERKNLAEKLRKAVLYVSDSADSYSEYAREKIRLFRNTKITLTEDELIQLICGSITNVDVKMASLNSNVATTSALISLLSTFEKSKKRPHDTSEHASSVAKRPRFNEERKCFSCNLPGHIQAQCTKKAALSRVSNQNSQAFKQNDFRTKVCTFCKKIGHVESVCYHKQRAENKSSSITIIPKEGPSFLGKPN